MINSRIIRWATMSLIILACSLYGNSLQAAKIEPVGLRVDNVEGGQRLFIEWPNPVKVLQKKDGANLVLRFSRPLTISDRSVLRRLTDYLHDDRTRVFENDLILALKDGVSTKLEIKKRRIVQIDLKGGQRTNSNAQVDVSTRKDGIRLTFTWPELLSIETESRQAGPSIRFNGNTRIDPSDIRKINDGLQPWFREIRSTKEPASTRIDFDLQPMVVSSVLELGKNQVAVDLARDALKPSKEKDPIIRPAFRPKTLERQPVQRSNLPPAMPEWKPRTAPQIEVATETQTKEEEQRQSLSEKGIELVFDWDRPVDAALFERAGYLWIVFDTLQSHLRSPKLPLPSNMTEESAVIQHDQATIIRLPIEPDMDVSINDRDEHAWVLRLGSTNDHRTAISITPDDNSQALHAYGPSNERIIYVDDPTVGDQLGIWPVSQAALGQKQRRRFVDIEFLPSQQGLVWRKLNERMVAEGSGHGIRFGSEKGLAVSSWGTDEKNVSAVRAIPALAPRKTNASEPVQEKTKSVPPSSYFGFVNFDRNQNQPGSSRRALRQLIGASPLEERDQHRLDLARLLIAERHGPEAQTVLSDMTENLPPLMATSKRALWGAAAWLNGDFEEAAPILNGDEFNDDEEIGIWRTALQSASGNWTELATAWKTNRDNLDRYPEKLRLTLGLLALEAAIKDGEDNMIRVGFRRLKDLDLHPRESAEIDRLHALRAIAEGDLESAEKILRPLTDRNLGAISLRAKLELASISLATEPDDPLLLKALNEQLPLWRGHPYEVDMVDSLAGWHRSANNPRKALHLWERLASLHPSTNNAPAIREPREATYAEAVNDLANGEIDFFDAYSIYLDFLDLLPEDSEKKQIIHRNLARHLVNLDLLDEAIDFLEPLTEVLGEDAIREETATEMARLLLLRGRPQEAVALLNMRTKGANGQSEKLVAKQKLIKAQAFLELDRYDDALEQARDLRLSKKYHVQAEVFWKQREWARLASVVEAFLNDPRASHPLSHDDKRLILWLALSQSQLGQTSELRNLRQRYADEIGKTNWASAFMVGTQADSEAGDIPSVLAHIDKQMDELKDFRRDEKQNQ